MENLLLPEIDLSKPPEWFNHQTYSFWSLKNISEPNYMALDQYWTPEECKAIIKLGRSFTRDKSLTGSGPAGGGFNPEIRRSINSWLAPCDLTQWIYMKAQQAVEMVNKEFQYDLASFEHFQFTEYDQEYQGTYHAHMDRFPTAAMPNSHRKLTFTIQLTSPDLYEGGELCLYETLKPLVAPKTLGTMIFLPSFMVHEVKPVTKGRRCSLVGWTNGPKFK